MFSGKVVLITGSSSGIGAGAAIHFVKLGASVTITGRNVNKLKKVAQQCEEISKKQPLVVIGDLCDEDSVKNLLEKTIEHYKKLDILVNNAGFGGFGDIQSTPLEQYKKTMNINLRAVYYLTMLATPYLIETKGSVINISSTAGIRPFPLSISYCMSKAGLDHFTRCVALELASKKVRVNSINPGPVYSNICQNAGFSDEQTEQMYEAMKKGVPLQRIATAEEIATVIAFLASEKSNNITGILLSVDAGNQLVCGQLNEH